MLNLAPVQSLVLEPEQSFLSLLRAHTPGYNHPGPECRVAYFAVGGLCMTARVCRVTQPYLLYTADGSLNQRNGCLAVVAAAFC